MKSAEEYFKKVFPFGINADYEGINKAKFITEFNNARKECLEEAANVGCINYVINSTTYKIPVDKQSILNLIKELK